MQRLHVHAYGGTSCVCVCGWVGGWVGGCACHARICSSACMRVREREHVQFQFRFLPPSTMSPASTISPTINCEGPANTHHAHAHGTAHACKTSNTLRAQQPKIESTAPPETRTGIGKRAYEHSHACTFYENLQHLRCHAQSRTPQKLALLSLVFPARRGAISILLVRGSLVSGPAQSTQAKRSEISMQGIQQQTPG